MALTMVNTYCWQLQIQRICYLPPVHLGRQLVLVGDGELESPIPLLPSRDVLLAVAVVAHVGAHHLEEAKRQEEEVQNVATCGEFGAGSARKHAGDKEKTELEGGRSCLCCVILSVKGHEKSIRLLEAGFVGQQSKKQSVHIPIRYICTIVSIFKTVIDLIMLLLQMRKTSLDKAIS